MVEQTQAPSKQQMATAQARLATFQAEAATLKTEMELKFQGEVSEEDKAEYTAKFTKLQDSLNQTKQFAALQSCYAFVELIEAIKSQIDANWAEAYALHIPNDVAKDKIQPMTEQLLQQVGLLQAHYALVGTRDQLIDTTLATNWRHRKSKIADAEAPQEEHK